MSQARLRLEPIKPRRTSLTGVLLTFVVSVMFVLAFTFVLFESKSEDNRLGHGYSVSIGVADDEGYEVLCPIPVDSQGKLRHGFEDEVEVTYGEVAIEVESTEHGPGLKIVGHGPVNITWTDHWYPSSGNRLDSLSMPVLQDGENTNRSWVYCDHGGLTISLRSSSMHVMMSDGMPRDDTITCTLQGTMIPVGWQQMYTTIHHFRLL